MKTLQNTFFVLLISLLLSSCQNGPSWEETLAINSVKSYQEFLKNNPETEYKDTIPILIEEVEWQRVLEVNQLDSFKVFQEKYQESVHTDTLDMIISAIEWEEVQKVNTIEAYEAFLASRTGKYTYKYQVQSKIEKLRWQKIKVSDSSVELVGFLSDYPWETYKDSTELDFTFNDLAGYSLIFYYQSGELAEGDLPNYEDRVVMEDIIISFYKDGTFKASLSGEQQETTTWGAEFKGEYTEYNFVEVQYRDLDFSDTEEEELGEWEECEIDFSFDGQFITVELRGNERSYDLVEIGKAEER